jgi:hypothetical protein
MKPVVAASLGMLVLTTIAASRLGGWAVVSLVDPPTHVVVGTPNAIDFDVRQHGEQPLGNLKPKVSARSGSHWVFAQAAQVGSGRYRATLNIPAVPKSDEWRIRVDAGFGRSWGTLVPLRAVAPGVTPPPLSGSDRGRQLFAAKGCISCHVHSAVDIEGELQDAGPDLSNRSFPAEYLARFLADPTVKATPAANGRTMPNPQLRPHEIAALVAFINARSQVSVR